MIEACARLIVLDDVVTLWAACGMAKEVQIRTLKLNSPGLGCWIRPYSFMIIFLFSEDDLGRFGFMS